MNWLQSKTFDCIFILAPPFLSVIVALVFSNYFRPMDNIPIWVWVVFVLGIDVSHVYSTLFRTYFNTKEFSENKSLFTILPILVFLVCVILYTIGANVFWRVLAYTAVFHFIRQQYGFMRLYSKNDFTPKIFGIIDTVLIYISTLYPIVYWHVNLPRNFRWFTDGDFINGFPKFFESVFLLIYIFVGSLYILKETRFLLKFRTLNIPKNLIILGTAISWYVGIVLFNGDIIFTITNVVSHGVPYMALVWIYGKKQAANDKEVLILNKFQYRFFFSNLSFPIFIASLIGFAYIEEGFWAGLVWREHLEVFGSFAQLPVIRAKDTLSWVIPLLTLPQATHYVLDGFIWRLKDNHSHWHKIFFK
jgi:hypothetical protein